MSRVLAIALVMLSLSGCEEAPGGRSSHDVHCSGSYGVTGKTLSPPDWIHGTWRQPYSVIAMGFITLSWTFSERNAVNFSHSAVGGELAELDEKLRRGKIGLKEYYDRRDEIVAGRTKTAVLDVKELGYPVIGESSSTESYTIRLCSRHPEGETRTEFQFRKSSTGLNYATSVSVLPVELVRG